MIDVIIMHDHFALVRLYDGKVKDGDLFPTEFGSWVIVC